MARHPSQAVAGAAAALLLGACAPAPPPQLAVGDPAPAAVTRAVSAEIVIAWISRPEDYLSCRSPAAVLRRLQRRYDKRLKIAAVAVDGDPRLAAEFVRAERLEATVVPLGRKQYEREFAASRLPGLYVIRDGRVVRAWNSGVTLNVVSGEPSQLSLAIQHLMESPGATARSSTHTKEDDDGKEDDPGVDRRGGTRVAVSGHPFTAGSGSNEDQLLP